MQGAEAPTRDETIVVGIESGIEDRQRPDVERQFVDALSINDLGTAKNDRLLVRGCRLRTRQRRCRDRVGRRRHAQVQRVERTSWTATSAVTAYTGGEPEQLQLAASPDSDEMVLAVTDKDKKDYALVWNGSSWGNRSR